jgi:ATP-dependent Zn protease
MKSLKSKTKKEHLKNNSNDDMYESSVDVEKYDSKLHSALLSVMMTLMMIIMMIMMIMMTMRKSLSYLTFQLC